MSTDSSRKVLAVLEDLFFTVKINDAAQRAGLPVTFVKSEKDALDQAAFHPAVILVDLNCTCLNPLRLVRSVKADPALGKIDVVGYVSHVQGELKQQAQEAGCNLVLARSAFSRNLPQILKRHSGAA